MTYEEMQRMMQFILEQQARFDANMQKMQEAQAQTGDRVTELENLVTRLAAATVEGFKDVNAKIDALVDAQIRTEETLGAKIDALAEAQIRTAENLDRTDGAVRNLAELIDRQLRGRQNGG